MRLVTLLHKLRDTDRFNIAREFISKFSVVTVTFESFAESLKQQSAIHWVQLAQCLRILNFSCDCVERNEKVIDSSIDSINFRVRNHYYRLIQGTHFC